MATENNQWPLTKFHFQVDLGDGKGNLSFQEVTGLEMTREKAEYRGGMDQGFVKQQIPAMKTFGELTLKRGTFAGNNDFFEWWESSEEDKMPIRRNLTISLLNSASNPVMTWKITNAFPTKVTSTDLNAENNELAIETLVLVHEGIRVEATK